MAVFVLKIIKFLMNFEFKVHHNYKKNNKESLKIDFFIPCSTVHIFVVNMATSEGEDQGGGGVGWGRVFDDFIVLSKRYLRTMFNL